MSLCEVWAQTFESVIGKAMNHTAPKVENALLKVEANVTGKGVAVKRRMGIAVARVARAARTNEPGLERGSGACWWIIAAARVRLHNPMCIPE